MLVEIRAEPVEFMLPEPAVLLQPLGRVMETARVELTTAHSPLPGAPDETGLFQHP